MLPMVLGDGVGRGLEGVVAAGLVGHRQQHRRGEGGAVQRVHTRDATPGVLVCLSLPYVYVCTCSMSDVVIVSYYCMYRTVLTHLHAGVTGALRQEEYSTDVEREGRGRRRRVLLLLPL